MSSLPCPQPSQIGFRSAAFPVPDAHGAPACNQSHDLVLDPRHLSAGEHQPSCPASTALVQTGLSKLFITVSREHPCLLITSTTNNNVPVFRTTAIKAIACAALRAAQKSGGFSILAYVLMPNHLHIITDGNVQPSRILRFVNGVTSHRIIQHLKKNRFQSSLEKIRAKRPSESHQFSIWQGRSRLLYLYTEQFFRDRLMEIHRAPVDAKLVAKPEDYRWSSYRIWHGQTLPDEPLILHLKPMRWEEPSDRGTTQHVL